MKDKCRKEIQKVYKSKPDVMARRCTDAAREKRRTNAAREKRKVYISKEGEGNNTFSR